MTVKFGNIEDSSSFIYDTNASVHFCYEDLVPRNSTDLSRREVTKSF